MRRLTTALLAAAAALAILPAAASARPAQALLSGANGEGTFNDTLTCAQGGDGPNWRHAWADQPAVSTGGLLAGTWDGTFEVHDAGSSHAFVPDHDGRVALSLDGTGHPDRVGTGHFESSGQGGCADADLTLATQPDGDPVVTGTLPITATGGSGALRGLTGTGSAQVELELGPGADNTASINLEGDFEVADPALSVTGASSRWRNFSDYLAGKLTVTVIVANAPGAGDAFNARLVSVTGATNKFTGLPTTTASIPAGQAASFTFTMASAKPGRAYSLNATADGLDGLLSAVPTSTGTASFSSPHLP